MWINSRRKDPALLKLCSWMLSKETAASGKYQWALGFAAAGWRQILQLLPWQCPVASTWSRRCWAPRWAPRERRLRLAPHPATAAPLPCSSLGGEELTFRIFRCCILLLKPFALQIKCSLILQGSDHLHLSERSRNVHSVQSLSHYK